MQRKVCISLLLIIVLIFAFSVSSYASTEYSVSSGDKYKLSISFKEKTEFNIPKVTVKTNYSSPNIYFLLIQEPSNTTKSYFLYSSTQPFKLSSRSGDGGNYFTFTNSGTVRQTYYEIKNNSWDTDTSTSHRYVRSYSYNILMSSDTIMDGDEVLLYAYCKSPLLKSVRSIQLKNSVTNEIISILSITLVILVSFISIRKAIAFVTNRLCKA